MARTITNPDIDPEFAKFYEGTQAKLASLMKTKNDVLILSAEGLLGLESAVASLVEKGEKVLAITNGVYGDGFVDLVKIYGGVPVKVEGEYSAGIEPERVKEALDANRDIRIATVVHCETPSGVLNPLREIGRICNDRGVVVIADAVSSMCGAPLEVDGWKVDVCLGASQKCISAPPGLAIVSLSDRAWEIMRARKDRIPSFYLNLWQWDEWWKQKRLFPYTPSISDIYALDEALDILLEEGLENSIQRHMKVSGAILGACKALGLKPYPERDECHSPTVTALRMPPGIDEGKLRALMERDHSVMIAGSWGKLSGNVFRLGNMGYNAQNEKAMTAILALEESLKSLGFKPKGSGVEAAKAILGSRSQGLHVGA